MGSNVYKRITLVFFNTAVFECTPQKGTVVPFSFWLRCVGGACGKTFGKALNIAGDC
jgi:hypothetical protein